MSVDVNTPAKCATCVYFNPKPNPLDPANGDCEVLMDDGLPPILPMVGISPDHPACEYYTFDRRKDTTND